MARYNVIFAGPAGDRGQTAEGLANVAITPGSIVTKNASGEFVLATGSLAAGNRAYIADHNWIAGRDNDTDNPADQTMISQIPLPRNNYAALLANGQNVTAVDTPLTVGASGLLEVGAVDTDFIVAWASEVYNNSTGSAQLIMIRWAAA